MWSIMIDNKLWQRQPQKSHDLSKTLGRCQWESQLNLGSSAEIKYLEIFVNNAHNECGFSLLLGDDENDGDVDDDDDDYDDW